jgi:hypothetical protein
LLVVYFDVWTKGIRCFKPIDVKFKNAGIKTKLIHVASFREKTKKHTIIDDIEAYDISMFNTISIFKVLEKEKPDLVFSLNTTFIFDRALVLACRELKIPCFFMSHGDFPTGDELSNVIEHFNKKRLKPFEIFNKLYSYFRYNVPNYVYSYLKSTEKPYGFFSMIRVIVSYLIFRSKSRYFAEINNDLIYDKAFIYSNLYLEHYKKVGYQEKNMVVTGYPEYDFIYEKAESETFSKLDLPDEVRKIMDSGLKYALYLDTSYADSNLFGWNYDYRNKHLTEIATRLKQMKLKLVVKIHPTNTCIENVFVDSNNVIVIQHSDLGTLSYFCEFAIVHYSTSNNVPLILNKPLVVPRWGLSAAIPLKYPSNIIHEWKNINDQIEFNKENIDYYAKMILPRLKGISASEIIFNKSLEYVGNNSK